MLKYLFFVVSFNTLGRLPLPLLYRVMYLAALAGYYLVPGARRNVVSNLRRVMPAGVPEREVARAARSVFRNVALYYADLARLPQMDVDCFFQRRLTFHGVEEHLRPAISAGKGVIMLSAHFGNPELAGQGLVPLGVRVFALTEPLYPRLSRFLDRIRSSKGHTFASVNVGNVKRVIKTLRKGGVVVLMGDRDIEGPKESLPFFGAEALMPTGPMEVAVRTGATVLPCFCARRGRYAVEAWIEPPLDLPNSGDLRQDVRNGCLRFIERLEPRLRADPSQWVVLEAVWDHPVAASAVGDGRGGTNG